MEIWRDIQGYEGLYQVSNYGRVKNRHGKIISQSLGKDGYLRVHLWKNGEGKHHLVHRLVAEAFIPNPQNKLVVGHTKPLEDGTEDKTANEAWNIAWMTYSENRMYGTCNERIQQAQKGRKFTDEHKKNISESLKNSEKFHEVIKSAEYLAKLSKSHKGKMINREDLSEPLDQIDPITGEVLASYPSAKQAARDTGFAQTNISRACNGGFFHKGKWINVTQAYGFIWKKKA